MGKNAEKKGASWEGAGSVRRLSACRAPRRKESSVGETGWQNEKHYFQAPGAMGADKQRHRGYEVQGWGGQCITVCPHTMQPAWPLGPDSLSPSLGTQGLTLTGPAAG